MDDMIDGVLGSIGIAPVKTATKKETQKEEEFQVASLSDPKKGKLIGSPEEPQIAPRLSAADELALIAAEKEQVASRGLNDQIGDKVLGVGAAFVGGVGNVITGASAVTGAAAQYLGEDGGLLDEFGQSASDYAVRMADTTETATGFIRGFQSDTVRENAQLNARQAQIESDLNQADFDEAIANGENEFIASLALVGKNAWDTTARVLSDPLALESVATDALGSLGPSAAIGSAAVKLASKTATRMGVREGSGLARAEIVGSALATGAVEGAGTYSQTVNSVMARTPEEMMTSPMYVELINGGMDPLEAQQTVADATGMDAFRMNFPAAIAAGVLSAKFNANPIKAFEGQAMVDGLASVGKETLEEAIQGSTSQISQNLAEASRVDNTIQVTDDVGEQLALGAIGGGVVSGGLGAVPTAINAIDQYEAAAEDRKKNAEFVRGMGKQIAKQRRDDSVGFTRQQAQDYDLRDAFTAPSPGEELFSSVVGRVADTASLVKERATEFADSNIAKDAVNLTKMAGKAVSEAGILPAAVDAVKAGATAVKGAVGPLVNKAIGVTQDFVEKPNPTYQNETVAAAVKFTTDATEKAVNTTDTKERESLNVVLSADDSVTTASLPDMFKDTIPEKASLADTMTGIVRTIAEKKIPISKMSDEAVLFVAEKFNQMQNAASSLPADMQKDIKKVMASGDLERIRKRAGRIDLKVAISDGVGAVSEGAKVISLKVKKLTAQVAAFSPVNVNPRIIDRILKQDDISDFTPDEIESMKIARDVSIPFNTYKDNLVRISDDRTRAIEATGQKVAPKNATEATSQNLLVGDIDKEISRRNDGVPSVADLANNIIVGMRSPDQSIETGDARVNVKDLATNLRNVAQHMVNKTNALKQSWDNNGPDGTGPNVMFDTLSGGIKFIKAGMAGSKAVGVNKRSVNAVTFAKTVGADTQVVVEVYNVLAQKFPEQFPDGPLEMPVQPWNEGTETNQKTETPVIENAAFETGSVSDENTTADEDVTTPVGTAEPQETPPTDQPETTAVEDPLRGSETPDLTIMSTQAEVDALSDDEIMDRVNTFEEDVQVAPMPKETEEKLQALMAPIIERLGLPKNIVRRFAFLESTEKSHLGQAYWAERIMGLKPSAIKNILAGEVDKGLHVLYHEFMHLVDAKASRRFGDTASMWAYDLEADGDIFAEVKDLMDKDPEMKSFFEGYALTFSEPRRVSSELFAEIGALWLQNPAKAEAMLPKGTAYVKQVIDRATREVVQIRLEDEQDQTDFDGEATQDVGVSEVVPEEVRPATKKFVSVFRPRKSETKVKNAKEILDKIAQVPGTENYLLFANAMLGRISAGMNQRLQTVLVSKQDGRSLAQGLKEETDTVLSWQRMKAMTIVDPETGTYDTRLLDLASMAVIDWLTTAQAFGADRMDDLLKDLGLDWSDLDQQQIQDLMNTVPVRMVSENLAKKVMKLWNVQGRPDAQMVDIRGASEGIVKEILTVLSQEEEPLISIVEVKLGEKEETYLRDGEVQTVFEKTASIDLSALPAEQRDIGFGALGSMDAVLFPEDKIMASFGEPLKSVPTSQENKPDVPLSEMERKAVKNMQDTPHLPAEAPIEFFKLLGLDAFARMSGRRDESKLHPRHPLRLTIAGKNTSIQRDFETAFQMVEAAAGRSVFYPVGITNVGRHQMKGINPQNNKLLRALITPTHAKLDMAGNQAHKDGFWLTVAQSSGLAKVEKKDHKLILQTIQEDFQAKFGEATQLVEEYLNTGTLASEAFADAMLKANKGEAVSVAQMNAVLAVARLHVAQRAGTLESFETSLSFELDGKTDGPANMMVAFGQGLMTRAEYDNFKRVGYMLGSKSETLNTFLANNQDLYEVNSVFATRRMVEMTNKAKGIDKQRMMALQRFATHFGDFVIDPTSGDIIMSRATSKNPMTKKVYGAADKGIAEGISQDMLMGFYEKLVNLPDGSTVEDHLNYPEIQEDLNLLFKVKFPQVLKVNDFILPKEAMVPFAEYVKVTIGSILSSSISEVISEKTTGVNELLVYITGVQSQFMINYFDRRLNEVFVEERDKWEAAGKTGAFSINKMSQEAYDSVVKEIMAFAPYYKDGLQNLRLSEFTGQVNKIIMSENLSGNLRPKATMARPERLGVRVIPYVTQGRGDAMMMNRIFGADNAPTRAIPIFDGIDMAITDFSNLSNQINEAVLGNWDHDVIGPLLNDFSGFLDKVEQLGLQDQLDKAFMTVAEESKKRSSVVAIDSYDLKNKLSEAHRLNQARKAVFKRIPIAVDHMGGSGKAFVRNEAAPDMTYEEINNEIQGQLDGKTGPYEPVTFSEPPVSTEATPAPVPVVEEVEDNLVVTDVATVVDAIIKDTKKTHIREAVRAIRSMLPNEARIVMGTREEIMKWRAENLSSGSKNLEQRKKDETKGFYDVENNVIFLMSDNHETITHELIHLATFQAVLSHYEGRSKNNAVKNLEVLMDEFMDMDFSTAPKAAQRASAAAKAQILKGLAMANEYGSAVALNEFMAWTLSNDALMKQLKATPTSLVAKLTKLARAWIQRVLGVIPTDMYSNILFNVEMVNEPNFPDPLISGNGGNNNTNNGVSGVTPPASNFTNFWIDLLRKSLDDAANVSGLNPIDLTKKRQMQQKLGAYADQAQKALDSLDVGGFGLSEYQKQTYKAIHTVIAVQLQLDARALTHLGKIYEHVTNNLTPAMFGTGQAAQDRYSTVMDLMGATRNDEGISDSVAVLLALSQTSTAFRKAMDQIPQPAATPGINTASLNDVLTSGTSLLMQKLILSTDTDGKGVKEILDGLSDKILKQDSENEFKALQGLMLSFDKADKFLGGAMSLLAQRAQDANLKLQNSQANGTLKVVGGTLALATQFLDADSSKIAAKGIKNATHMGGVLDMAIPIRELVTEIIGSDETNVDVIQMLSRVNYAVQGTRQDMREDLPVILQNEFTNHPTPEGWKALHHVLGKADFAALFDLKDPDASFDLMNDQQELDRKIKQAEAKIRREFPGQMGTNILEKSQQLADFMNGKGPGHQLFRNAYAIHKLVGGRKPGMVSEIDRLVSMYALNGTNIAQREAVAKMQATDPKGVHSLLTYIQALNKEEDLKIISEEARTNGYKGYIPDFAKGDISLRIANDSDREALEKRGYKRVGDDTTDSGSLISRGYYMSTVKQGGNYSQGVLQQVQDTYRGVNATTGLTVNGTTSGVISGNAVITITDYLNKNPTLADPKAALIPVYDASGDVLYYERALNPDMIQKYLQPESHMALMIGAWAGRQIEEKLSHEYNKALVAKLKSIWENREPGTDALFTRMDTAKDKIYRESWDVIPPQLKQHIMSEFGEDTGFMVKKDMINLALGYRDPSITDVWTGNHRLPEGVALAVKAAGKVMMGDKAYSWLANTESFTMSTISSAKDLIVVRSLVVPIMNTQSNVFQLVGRGVGTKDVMRGYRDKFVEIDKLNANIKKIKALEVRKKLEATNPNKVRLLNQQIQVLEDENSRFSVSALVKEGLYTNISEGLTEMDVSITDGKFGDWVESQLNKLPGGVQTVAKYGLLSKDTAIYKGANKAVQYGDFIAKSIYYDDLIRKGMDHKTALGKVNEEFVNFSILPGRMRTGLEAIGATWFLTFKIRSMKTALQMMRENPVRSLSMVGVLGLESGPITDNFGTKLVEGTLPYSLGLDMLWDSPSMNPWYAMTLG